MLFPQVAPLWQVADGPPEHVKPAQQLLPNGAMQELPEGMQQKASSQLFEQHSEGSAQSPPGK